MKAIVITGPTGCGKTTLAKHIAGCLGSFCHAGAEIFSSPFALAAALKNEPDTLILDGLSHRQIVGDELKEFLGSRVIRVSEKGRESYLAPMPYNFILCTGENFALPADDRRFHVIHL